MKYNNQVSQDNQGFSLIEVLVSFIVVAFVVLVGFFVYGHYSSQSVAKTAKPQVSALNTPVTTLSTSSKPPLAGLIDMGNQTAYQTQQSFPTLSLAELANYKGDFSGVVINEGWNQLEPSAGVYNWQPLNQSLAVVSNWNKVNPTAKLSVKLRIFAGFSAPSWLVAESGPSVQIYSHGTYKTVGRWWVPTFMSAWSQFQHALAKQYDLNPLITAVSVSSCSSSTGEPFVVSGSVISQRNLAAAGWTLGVQENCLNQALNDYSGWQHTAITFAFNAIYDPNGNMLSFLDSLMTACANSLENKGPDCVLGNNDLSTNIASSTYSAVSYNEIANLVKSNPKVEVYFQTAGGNYANLVNDCQAMALGTDDNATSIELWPPVSGANNQSGFNLIPSSTLASWNESLINHQHITCN